MGCKSQYEEERVTLRESCVSVAGSSALKTFSGFGLAIVAALEFPNSRCLKCKENEFSSELAEKLLRVSIVSRGVGMSG